MVQPTQQSAPTRPPTTPAPRPDRRTQQHMRRPRPQKNVRPLTQMYRLTNRSYSWAAKTEFKRATPPSPGPAQRTAGPTNRADVSTRKGFRPAHNAATESPHLVRTPRRITALPEHRIIPIKTTDCRICSADSLLESRDCALRSSGSGLANGPRRYEWAAAGQGWSGSLGGDATMDLGVEQRDACFGVVNSYDKDLAVFEVETDAGTGTLNDRCLMRQFEDAAVASAAPFLRPHIDRRRRIDSVDRHEGLGPQEMAVPHLKAVAVDAHVQCCQCHQRDRRH